MYTNDEKLKKLVVIDYIKRDIIIVFTYYYLERKNYKVMKFHMSNSSHFEINNSLSLSLSFKYHHPISIPS